MSKAKEEGVGRGNAKASQANLKASNGFKAGDPQLVENQKKGVETRKKRSKFKEIFETVLTDEKQTIMAEEFVNIVLDKSQSINNRCRVFEIILKIIGEDGSLSGSDFKELADHITLKID